MQNSPSRMQIFVSHSHKNDAAGKKLVDALRGAGADVWYDEHNLTSGKLGPTIERELRARPVFIVVLSPAALASSWVEDETRWAYNLQRKDPRRIMLPVLCAKVAEDDIWLFLQEYKRIEAPGGKPLPDKERIRQTLRALALTQKGQDPVAILPRQAETVVDLLTQGKALQAQKKHVEALPFFERAALRDPDSFDAWFNLGYTLSRLKRWDEALPPCERATVLDSTISMAWNNKGAALSSLNRDQESLVAFEKACDLDPNNPLAWNNKGHELRLTGQYEQALQAVDKALGIDERSAVRWTTKGEILNDLGRYDEALSCFEWALELDAQHASAWTGKAVALNAQGHEVEADEADQRAVELGG